MGGGRGDETYVKLEEVYFLKREPVGIDGRINIGN
jgi:hypothetical protein